MYVIGEIDLDRMKLHYLSNGEIIPEGADTSDAAGTIVWTTRRMRAGDRHMFAPQADDTESDPNRDRAILMSLTVSVEGLAIRSPGADEPTPVTKVTEENYDYIDAGIVARVMRRITDRMEATFDALGESEKPSDT